MAHGSQSSEKGKENHCQKRVKLRATAPRGFRHRAVRRPRPREHSTTIWSFNHNSSATQLPHSGSQHLASNSVAPLDAMLEENRDQGTVDQQAQQVPLSSNDRSSSSPVTVSHRPRPSWRSDVRNEPD